MQPLLPGFVTVHCSSGRFSKHGRRAQTFQSSWAQPYRIPVFRHVLRNQLWVPRLAVMQRLRPISLHAVTFVLSLLTLNDGFVRQVMCCVRSKWRRGEASPTAPACFFPKLLCEISHNLRRQTCRMPFPKKLGMCGCK